MRNNRAKENIGIFYFFQFCDKITQDRYQTKIAKQGASMSFSLQNNKSIGLVAPPPLKKSYARK